MVNFIQRFMEVPIMDPDDRRRARLLNILVFGLAIIAALAALISLVGYFVNPEGRAATLLILVGSFVFLAGTIAIFAINRAGKVLLSGSLFLAILTFSLYSADKPEAMVNGRNLFFFVLPILIASIILRPYASFIAAALVSILIVVVSLTLHIPGNLSIAPLGFFAIALVSWLAARSLEDALAGLRIINQELDQRVIERTQELGEANLRLEQQTDQLAQANVLLENQAHELFNANEQLRDLDRLKTKFVSDVTHELRTPINNIAIYVEMLRHGKAQRQERYLEVLQEEAERLTGLVTGILDFSRLETGLAQVMPSWVDVNGVAEQVVGANRLRAEAKGLAVILEPDKNLPPIWADRNQVSQVLNNLIGNAINYTQAGSIRMRIFQDQEPDFVSIEVGDTGMGIYPEDLPHIFERFYRGQQASQSNLPGTGLGLAITKELVESQGGRIEVASEPGIGSTFTIRLPVRQVNLESEKS